MHLLESFKKNKLFNSLNNNKVYRTDNSRDYPRRNIPIDSCLFPQRDNRKNEMFVRQVHVERHVIFPKDTHRLLLKYQNFRNNEFIEIIIYRQ